MGLFFFAGLIREIGMAIEGRGSYSSAGAFFALRLLFGILLKPVWLERVMSGGGVKWVEVEDFRQHCACGASWPCLGTPRPVYR